MAVKARPASSLMLRAEDLRARLDELRRAGTANNVTLEILTELTEIVALMTRRLNVG